MSLHQIGTRRHHIIVLGFHLTFVIPSLTPYNNSATIQMPARVIFEQNKCEKDATDELEIFVFFFFSFLAFRSLYTLTWMSTVRSKGGKGRMHRGNRANEWAQLTKIYDWIFVSIWHVRGRFRYPNRTVYAMWIAIVFLRWNYTYKYSNLNSIYSKRQQLVARDREHYSHRLIYYAFTFYDFDFPMDIFPVA